MDKELANNDTILGDVFDESILIKESCHIGDCHE